MQPHHQPDQQAKAEQAGGEDEQQGERRAREGEPESLQQQQGSTDESHHHQLVAPELVQHGVILDDVVDAEILTKLASQSMRSRSTPGKGPIEIS
ncbi:hypothetical protein [Aeromonas dhakensis]|uniref:hypothetical protein n=1 Tax=Aeromonas dhakensis TaxID=196024 RepID=UPI003F7A031D